jgi:hypothetical protein
MAPLLSQQLKQLHYLIYLKTLIFYELGGYSSYHIIALGGYSSSLFFAMQEGFETSHICVRRLFETHYLLLFLISKTLKS